MLCLLHCDQMLTETAMDTAIGALQQHHGDFFLKQFSFHGSVWLSKCPRVATEDTESDLIHSF